MKKGFTLVELLAVIAILAILVIIALPNVMGMFNTAKENSFKTEVKEIYKVAQQTWMQDSMFKTDQQVYSRCDSGCSNSLDLSGRSDLQYCIKINKAGDVTEYYATDGTFQYSYNNSNGLKIEDIKDVQKVSGSNMALSCDGINEPLPTGDSSQGIFFNPYKNNRTGEYYTSLKAAFDVIENNQLIQMLNDSPSNETENVTLAAGKTGVKLDLNGKKLKLGSKSLTNNGDLDIYNSSTTDSSITTSGSFSNNGTLKINGSSTNGKLTIACDIRSTGTLTINDNSNIYDSGSNVIYLDSGTAYVNGGRIRAGNTYDYDSTGIYVGANAELFVSGENTVIYGGSASSISGINNRGVTTINGGDISGPRGISNYGTLIINDGKISGDYGLYNSGTATMKDGSSTGETYGVYNTGTNANITITGGTITGGTRYSWSNAIKNSSSCTITIGDNSTSVNINSPIIEATSSSGNAISNDGTFNFYDGIVKGKSEPISGTGTIVKPDGYQVYTETIDGVKRSYLKQ